MNEFKEGWVTLIAAVIGTMGGLIIITNYTQGLFVGPVTQSNIRRKRTKQSNE